MGHSVPAVWREKIGAANRLNKETRGRKISIATKGKPKSEETRKKMSISATGRIFSEETKQKLRAARRRRIFSEETKRKISESHKGKKNPLWKGGSALAEKRHAAKRRLLGFIPLNDEFKDSNGHHLDNQHVIFIPEKLHRSVKHTLSNFNSMERINTKVYCWLLGVGIVE